MQRITRLMAVGMLSVGMTGVSAVGGEEGRRPANLQVPSGPGITAFATRSAGRAGEVFKVDVFMSNIADLGAYQIKLKATGGTQGSLTLRAASIDKSRADFVFGTHPIIDTVSMDTGILLAAKNVPVTRGSTVVTKPRYAGTFSFVASADAKGVFSIGVEKGPAASMMTNSDAQTLPFEAGTATTITIGAVSKRPVEGR